MSPSFSQIYSELKRLEAHGFATSRVEHDGGPRGRRTYKVTESRRDAVTRWATEAPIGPTMLKHGVLLRVWLGHLNEPDRLKEILQQHIAHVDTTRQPVSSSGACTSVTVGPILAATPASASRSNR
jgi:DNA-binding PadR family transcriptional regulator